MLFRAIRKTCWPQYLSSYNILEYKLFFIVYLPLRKISISSSCFVPNLQHIQPKSLGMMSNTEKQHSASIFPETHTPPPLRSTGMGSLCSMFSSAFFISMARRLPDTNPFWIALISFNKSNKLLFKIYSIATV